MENSVNYSPRASFRRVSLRNIVDYEYDQMLGYERRDSFGRRDSLTSENFYQTDLELVNSTYGLEDQNGFIRKVYALFTFQMLATTIFMAFKIQHP